MLGELNDDEVEVARENVRGSFRVLLPEPYQFELTMRQPHSLRLLMSTISNSQNLPEGLVEHIPPVIRTDFLETLWRRTEQNLQLRADFLILSKCCLDDIGKGKQQLRLAAISMGVGALSAEGTADLPTDVLNRLLAQGYVKRVSLLSSLVIVPTVPELLSAACIEAIVPRVLEQARSVGFEEAKELLLRLTQGLALGDRVAAAVMLRLVPEESDVLFEILKLLLEDEPKEEFKERGNFLLPLPGGRAIELVLDGESMLLKNSDGSESKIEWPDDEGPLRFIGGVHSWHILSHLSYSGIALSDGEEVYPLAPSIFMRVGAFRSTLRDVGRASLHHSNSVYEHTLPGYGTVPCPGRGIVEPITYGMSVCIQNLGETSDSVVEEAIQQGDPALLMRLYVAASSLDGIADKEIAARAQRMKDDLHSALDDVFEVIHADDE